jgi:hypothetical protein
MAIMVGRDIGSYSDVLTYQFYLTFISLTIVIISIQNKVVNKGHVEVYRTSVDELLQFHQVK